MAIDRRREEGGQGGGGPPLPEENGSLPAGEADAAAAAAALPPLPPPPPAGDLAAEIQRLPVAPSPRRRRLRRQIPRPRGRVAPCSWITTAR
ncbi:hypothetical protein JRQ81_012382, partial [Phrynocephalus forsythii]